MKRPLRVLLVTTRPPHVGGQQTHMDLLAAQLARRGHGIRYLQLSPQVSRVAAGLSVWCAGSLGASGYHRHVVRPACLRVYMKLVARSFAPDVVATHDSHATLAASRALPGIPIVQTIHGPMYEHSLEWGKEKQATLEYIRAVELDALSRASAIIAVDQGQADLALTKGADPARVHVIPNAVDVDELIRIARNPCRYALQQPYALVLRRLAAKNGVRYAIEGFAESAAASSARLVIAGGGSQLEELQALAQRLLDPTRVVFLGPVSHADAMPLLKNAAASIVPSVPYQGVIEATSLTVLESLSLRVPVIGSDIGGISEIDGGTESILLVPPGDPRAIAAAIDEVFSGTPNVKQGVARGVERVQREFSIDTWTQRILRVYEQALADNLS